MTMMAVVGLMSKLCPDKSRVTSVRFDFECKFVPLVRFGFDCDIRTVFVSLLGSARFLFFGGSKIAFLAASGLLALQGPQTQYQPRIGF